MADAQASGSDPAPPDAAGMAPRLAWSLTAVVFGCLCLISFLSVLALPISRLAVALALACMLALFVLQMMQCRWAGDPRRRRAAYAVLVAQALLAYLPLLYFHQAWVGMPSFFGGSVLLVLPGRAAWAAFAGVVASMAFVQAGISGNPLEVGYTSVATVVFGLTIYGLSHLRDMVHRLRAVQRELATAAVTRERLRFARDLHGLLGHSLSAMLLRAELAHRLAARRSPRAQEEVEELLQSSRQALADVRSVARGYRDFSLETEFRSVRSVLSAAGVDLRLRTEHGELPAQVGTVLGGVIREGVTNLLRHSRAENCEITVRRHEHGVTAEIVNDGSEGSGTRPATRPSGGLPDLSDRAAQLGGALTAEILEGGRFRLAVDLPLLPDGSEDEPHLNRTA